MLWSISLQYQINSYRFFLQTLYCFLSIFVTLKKQTLHFFAPNLSEDETSFVNAWHLISRALKLPLHHSFIIFLIFSVISLIILSCCSALLISEVIKTNCPRTWHWLWIWCAIREVCSCVWKKILKLLSVTSWMSHGDYRLQISLEFSPQLSLCIGSYTRLRNEIKRHT